MAISGKDFARTYPHKDAELFKLHCTYHKHTVMLREQDPHNKGIYYGLCSCGAVFFLAANDVLFPIWQIHMERGTRPAILGNAEVRWNLAYWDNEHSQNFDLGLLRGLGLSDAEATV